MSEQEVIRREADEAIRELAKIGSNSGEMFIKNLKDRVKRYQASIRRYELGDPDWWKEI